MIIKCWYFGERREIMPQGSKYLTRWILFECPWFGVYLHKFWDSDFERALHDHPWNFISIILKGSYMEHCQNTTVIRHPFSVAYRPATHRHRVELMGEYVWTLMLVSGRKRMWGFWPNGNFCWWRKFNQRNNVCENEILHTYGKD